MTQRGRAVGARRFGQLSRHERAHAVARRQRLALVACVGVLLGAMVVFALVATPENATHADAISDTLILENTNGTPVVLDLATGAIAGKFSTALFAHVAGGRTASPIEPVPTDDGTLMLDTASAHFNWLDPSNFLVKRDGPGIAFPCPPPARGCRNTEALGFGSGRTAYVLTWQTHRATPYVGVVARQTVAFSPPRLRAATTLDIGVDPQNAARAAVVDGHLWLFGRSAGALHLVDVRVDTSGTRLVTTDHGAVDDPSVLTTAALGTNRSPSVAVVGSPASLRNESRAGARAVPTGVAGADAVIGTTGSTSVAWFAVHDARGWSVVGLDVAHDRRVGPVRLSGAISASAHLATPAWDGGALYTTTTPRVGPHDGAVLLRIDPRTGVVTPVTSVTGAPQRYPNDDRVLDFRAVRVIATRGRVVYNVPAGRYAVVVFTDGSHAPTVVDKSDDRFTIDPTATPGQSATRKTTPSTGRHESASTTVPAAPPKTAPPPPPPDPIRHCDTSTQQPPHKPFVVQALAEPRAITLRWQYRVQDTLDCYPTWYRVTVTPRPGQRSASKVTRDYVGRGGPQEQFRIDGLKPNTTYELRVTASINDNDSTSDPYDATTAGAGADPPTRVAAVAEPKARRWIVTWDACDADQCDVPAAAWHVAAETSPCGTAGTLGDVADVDGSEHQVAIPYGAFVGRSVRFRVNGVAPDTNEPGSSVASACVAGIAPPDASRLRFGAGNLPPAAGGVAVRLSLDVTGDPFAAFGSTTATLKYFVDGIERGAHGLPVTGHDTLDVAGLAPGVDHSARVEIDAAGGSAQLDAPSFHGTVVWPGDLAATVTVAGSPNADNHGAIGGTITDAFGGVQGAPMQLHVDGTLQCGQAATALTAPVTPAGTNGAFLFDQHIDLVTMGRSCALTGMQLVEDSTPARHGVPVPVPDVAFTLGDRNLQTVGTVRIQWEKERRFVVSLLNAPAYGGDVTLTMKWSSVDAPDWHDCGIATTYTRNDLANGVTPDISGCITDATPDGGTRMTMHVDATSTYLGRTIPEDSSAIPYDEATRHVGPEPTTTTSEPDTTPTTTDATTGAASSSRRSQPPSDGSSGGLAAFTLLGSAGIGAHGVRRRARRRRAPGAPFDERNRR